jgi:hypothetical protein
MVLVFTNLQQFGVAAACEMMKKLIRAEVEGVRIRAVSTLLTPRLEDPEQIETALQQARSMLPELIPMLMDTATPLRKTFSEAQLAEFEKKTIALLQPIVEGRKAPFHLVPTARYVTEQLGWTLEELQSKFLPYRTRMEISVRVGGEGMSLISAFQLLKAVKKDETQDTYTVCHQTQHVSKIEF